MYFVRVRYMRLGENIQVNIYSQLQVRYLDIHAVYLVYGVYYIDFFNSFCTKCIIFEEQK